MLKLRMGYPRKSLASQKSGSDLFLEDQLERIAAEPQSSKEWLIARERRLRLPVAQRFGVELLVRRLKEEVAPLNQTRAVLVGLMGPAVFALSDHSGSSRCVQRCVPTANATYVAIARFLNSRTKSRSPFRRRHCAHQRMLRPTCSTISTYAFKGADGFSPFHATQASVATAGVTGRNTTFLCGSFLSCSGTRATPKPAEMAWIIVRSRSTSCKTFGIKSAR